MVLTDEFVAVLCRLDFVDVSNSGWNPISSPKSLVQQPESATTIEFPKELSSTHVVTRRPNSWHPHDLGLVLLATNPVRYERSMPSTCNRQEQYSESLARSSCWFATCSRSDAMHKVPTREHHGLRLTTSILEFGQ